MAYKLNVNTNSRIVRFFINQATHFNYDSYWKMRNVVIDPQNKIPRIIKLWYLYRIKKCDAFHNASLGTDLHKGAVFRGRPILMHGLNGIVISHYARFGEGCYLCQRVTVAQAMHSNDAPMIGDKVYIGAGAVIVGGVTVGDGAVIGANAVVTSDIPPRATAVGIPARVIKIDGERVSE